ncbi:HNH endonuclease [Fictibacillus solisalsi]|uniref:HNH endonuclease n=1 Tax=Fictibacillus solisalsi TaxID=459525 RepID=A0A1H0BK34_9BACL|nr:HNH endonuclease signature motif containing protein [Fictibacillus solisalsi]SDN46028.1 HNH endonuclease [Fictibacillus solisalsi]
MNFFLVFQNKSFREEFSGGYLWAPKQNKFGQTFHHWNDMRNVSQGDVIFNSYNGQMVSVLIAKDDCKEHERPVGLDELDLWEKDGYMVEAEYINLVSPINYKDHMDSILQLQGEKYAPFNRAGRGNTGYLFRVTAELANFLFEIIERKNGHTKEQFFIHPITDKQVITEVEEGLDSTAVLDNTEKDLIIKARVGHSRFKNALLNKEMKCKICGVSDSRFLVASHIKPWSKSDNQERLDVNNGLLLCPNHDSLFDRGLISFNENGEILISPSLDEATKVFMNIHDFIQIQLTYQQQYYMEWHREKFFTFSLKTL